VKPYTLEERLMHVRDAERLIPTGITWICDGMENEAKHMLGNRPNSEFIFDPEGTLIRMRKWSNPDSLRKDLEDLIGPVETPTHPDSVQIPSIVPPEVAPKGIVDRIEAPTGMRALKIEPTPGRTPFYVKLRAEVTKSVFKQGSGSLYLGFHLDPIYRVHWNNLVKPVRFKIAAPEGITVSPASGIGPEVDSPTDGDPREFLVNISGGTPGARLEITVHYFGCNDEEGWCIPVTQKYAVLLEEDHDGGGVFGRSFGPSADERVAGMMELDTDGDDRISREEANERLLKRFDSTDANFDSLLTEEEVRTMVRKVTKETVARQTSGG
jgi:hypothetical protein